MEYSILCKQNVNWSPQILKPAVKTQAEKTCVFSNLFQIFLLFREMMTTVTMSNVTAPQLCWIPRATMKT